MKNIVLLIAMLATGVAGYFVGAREGEEAKEALARVEQAVKAKEADAQKTKTALEKRIGELTAEHDKEVARINQDYEKQKADWNVLLAGRDKRIKELTAANGGTLKEIEKLRSALEQSASPEQRKALEEKIAQLEQEMEARAIEIAGLKCSALKVPADMLSKLRGEEP